jgi:hypothetical protein
MINYHGIFITLAPEGKGKPNWKGKSQGPHQTQTGKRAKQPDPLPQLVKPTQNLA